MPSRAELQPDMSTLEPIVNSVAPPSAPALPDAAPRSNPLLRTTLAPTQWQQPDAQRNFFQHGVPQIRISPLPASAQAGIGSAALGQAANAVKPVSALANANTRAIEELQLTGFQGAWSATISYAAGALVDFGGVIYIALQASLNAQPDITPTVWQNSGGTATFLGTWNSGTAYVDGNSVIYTNTTTGVTAFYIAIAPSKNKPPSSNPSFWQVTGSSSTYVNLGAYNNGTTYFAGNQVSYNPSGGGSQYWICISQTTGNAPTQASSFWELVGTSAANLNGLDGVAPSQTGQNLVFNGDFSVATVPSGLQSATASAIRVQDPGGPSCNGWTRGFENNGVEGKLYQFATPASQGLVGPYSLVIQENGVSNADFATVCDAFAVRQNTLYTFSANLNVGFGSGFPAHATWYFRVLWYKVGATNFTRLSSDLISFVDIVAGSTASGQQAPSGTLTAPANAGYARIAFYHWSDGTAHADWNLLVSNVRCVNTLDDISDGSTKFGQTASGLSYRPLSNPILATESGASVTISISAFTMRTSSKGDISINSGSIASLSPSTTYYLYYTDASLAGGSVSFSSSTTKTDALNGAGRFYVGSVVTPASGSGLTVVGRNDGGAGAQVGGVVSSSAQKSAFTGTGLTTSGSLASPPIQASKSGMNGGDVFSITLSNLGAPGAYTNGVCNFRCAGTITEGGAGSNNCSLQITFDDGTGNPVTTSASTSGALTTATLADAVRKFLSGRVFNPASASITISANVGTASNSPGASATLQVWFATLDALQ